VVRAGTLRELAELFELPADVLEEEVADYNRAVREGHDRFGRREFGEPLTAPFYGSLVTGALAHTQGGLRIDPTCRVLREDNTPIEGLYAVGGTAVGMSGNGPEGYLSGNGLAHAFGTGLIAGESLARSVLSPTG
jgi:fumarate reductase flavoprotein subunit